MSQCQNLLLLIGKNRQDLPSVCSMISNNFNRRWLLCEKTSASEQIIGIFQKKIRGLIQERWVALHPAGMGLPGGKTIKQINSSLNGLIPEKRRRAQNADGNKRIQQGHTESR
jgi:hypothetical protein